VVLVGDRGMITEARLEQTIRECQEFCVRDFCEG